ncbi:hypothetical protein CDN98_21805 [Roseateles terrae]|nr:hypothetical protein CDN98_21805 [Roseateles terrae]
MAADGETVESTVRKGASASDAFATPAASPVVPETDAGEGRGVVTDTSSGVVLSVGSGMSALALSADDEARSSATAACASPVVEAVARSGG